MGKTTRREPTSREPKPLKPREQKRLRRQQASAPTPSPQALEFPEPDAPLFKPMG